MRTPSVWRTQRRSRRRGLGVAALGLRASALCRRPASSPSPWTSVFGWASCCSPPAPAPPTWPPPCCRWPAPWARSQAEVDVTFTALTMSHQGSPEEWPLIATRHVHQRVIDYQDLTRVDHLVRAVLARGDRPRRRPRRAPADHLHRPRPAALGGHPRLGRDERGRRRAARRRLAGRAARGGRGDEHRPAADGDRPAPDPRRSTNRSPAGALATLIAVGASATPLDVDVQLVVTANIVMLLAGIGFMGALQDALTGFYITAGARLTEALLATAGIIAGVSGGLGLASCHRGRHPVDHRRPDRYPAGRRCGVRGRRGRGAFAFSSYSPKRMLGPVALVAAVAMSISLSIEEPGHRPHLVGGARRAVRRPGRLRAWRAGCGSRR